MGFSTTNKQRFISLIFPKGIRYQDGILRTLEKSYLFKFIERLETQKLKKTTLVTLRESFSNYFQERLINLGKLIKDLDMLAIIPNINASIEYN